MKTFWECTWEFLPGDGEHAKIFNNFEEAKKDLRAMISTVDVSDTLSVFRQVQNHAFRRAIADFLTDYFARPTFFSVNDPLPSHEPDDYLQDSDEDFDEDEREDIEALYVSHDTLEFKYCGGEAPFLDTNMVTMKNKSEDYHFTFYLRAPTKNSKVRELNITLNQKIELGTSAYPLLILKTLENSRNQMTQEDIIRFIAEEYETKLERKAVGRNLAILKELKFGVERGEDGYYIKKSPSHLTPKELDLLVNIIDAAPDADPVTKKELKRKLSFLYF